MIISCVSSQSSASVDDCSVIYSSVIPKKGRKKKAVSVVFECSVGLGRPVGPNQKGNLI